MTEDKRLGAAMRWWDTPRQTPGDMGGPADLATLIAAIDVADDMRKPVTEDEAQKAADIYFATLRVGRGGRPVNYGMQAVLTAFLAGRGVAARTEPEPAPVVTDEMVERAVNYLIEADWGGHDEKLKLRHDIRRALEAAIGTAAPSSPN